MFQKTKEQLSRFACGVTRSSMTKFIALIAGAVYLFCMVAWPIWHYRAWIEIQGVWDRWQALNVGILAFLASVLLWYAAHYRSKKNDEKEYKAAKVLLLYVVEDINNCLEECPRVLYAILAKQPLNGDEQVLFLPAGSIPCLEKYIKYSRANEAQYAADVVSLLQVFVARYNRRLTEAKKGVASNCDVLDLIKRLCIVKARADRLYDQARSLGELDTARKISAQDIKTAFASLGFTEFTGDLFTDSFFEEYKEE